MCLARVLMVVAIQAPLTVLSAPGDVTSAGKQFVELLAKEHFAGAVARFDATMKTALPEPKLRETWQALQAQAGPFQKQLGVRATKVAGYDVALVTCRFERTVLDTKVVFDAKGQVTGLFFVPSASGPPPGEVTSAGKQFVELLAKEDFAGAVARCDATVKTALPEPKLREYWQALQAQAGPFQKQLGARATKVAGYDVALVTCQFERMVQDAKVVFDAKGQVAGLGFLPIASEPPPYARTNAFREKEFTVGRGEWRLPGTLTLPTAGVGPWPAVVLVHGSGPQDRDETIGANKPFRDLAWGLATKGIAVLRYEKRTKEYGAKFMAAGVGHITVKEETIDDALSAVAQLRATDGLDPKRIFVLGHSRGGIVAPRIGQADPQIGGLIILAGCLSRPLEDRWVEQVHYLFSLKEKPSAEEQAWLAEFESTMAKVKKLTAADASSSALLMGVPPAYWLDLHQHDSLAIAKQLKQPLLILQGGRDYQVPQMHFDRWKEVFRDQSRVTFKLYPKLNHLFIAGEGTSTPAEYLQPGHVAETVVADVAEWIRGR